jgi:putative transcriptional regulator
MSSEKKQFQEDLLESVKQMRSEQASRVTTVSASISLSLPVEVIERWKASGSDWQLRMAKLLSESQPQKSQ